MPARIWIFWALFLVRGAFYSAMLPMWEGWDEYAHFAWIQHWVDKATLPRTTDRISREIDESMRLAPLPRELGWIGGPYLTHSEWWALPEAERVERLRFLRGLSPSLAHSAAADFNGRPFVFYEAQQPPLFYWIAGVVLRPMGGWWLGDRVILMRLLSVLLTSVVVPFTYLAARRVLGSGAVYCAALLAVAPGLAIDSARVANDGLAIGLAAVVLWLLARDRGGWVAAGLVLGMGILAKASLLVLLPISLMICGARRGAKITAVGLAVGGWWYVRNLSIGMPLTGWQESVGIGAMAVNGWVLIRSGLWVNEVYTVAKSFTWFGAWSFMTLRTWMYLALEVVGIGGMAAGIAMRKPEIRVARVFVAWFLIAIAGGAAAYYAVHRVAGIPGWYLWPAGGAMAILIAAGLGRFSILFAWMLALTDLFGVAARMMPYYAGLAAWNHGSVTQVREAAVRLHVSVWFVIVWAAATLAVPLLCAQGRAKTRM